MGKGARVVLLDLQIWSRNGKGGAMEVAVSGVLVWA
jgi:hypothetical protein